MYLSSLLIDVGDNPDRPRPGRLWLRNVYHVHQRLSMGFPTPDQWKQDREFLKPFNPDDFQAGRFLFRIDNTIEANAARAVIVVQSDMKPEWGYAFQNAQMFLAAPPQVREQNLTASNGEIFRFRIRMNLSKKSKQSKDGMDLTSPRPGLDSKGRPKAQSKRVNLTWDSHEDPQDVIRAWFNGKGKTNGFEVREFRLLHMGRVIGSKPNRGEDVAKGPTHRMNFQSALLDGELQVTEAEAFRNALISGIGSAKAFGFGLLTIAPLRENAIA